ncbi:glycosyltransferase [Limosilactobacillus reuteri]|uniref:glycosyltransferase n=1 Tax=Limosilactobacillus reuteri TaxID=1598 RepID=UPI000E3C1194|nr:glycosyltransferase [Limosilactobacillus reuteri]
MIFVTVGTHEQPFNRLIEEVDKLVVNGYIKEQVIIQTGYSTYKPHSCMYKSMFSSSEMNNYISNARIIITHGGPSSFVAPLQYGKIPIVVPRQAKYNEHINDHQVDFVKLITQKLNNIIPVYNIKTLGEVIRDYNEKIMLKSEPIKDNNRLFNVRFEKIVNSLFEDRGKIK